ncbi:MAG: VanZ family protein [Bacilli bacterium]
MDKVKRNQLIKKIIYSTILGLASIVILFESIKSGQESSNESNAIVDVISGGDNSITPSNPTSINFDLGNESYQVGSIVPFNVTFEEGTTDSRVIFDEYDPSLISIDIKNKTMTALKEGTTILKISSFATEHLCMYTKINIVSSIITNSLNIPNNEINSISIDETSIYKYGSVYKLDYKLFDKNNEEIKYDNIYDLTNNISFESSDKDIFTIDNYGYILGTKKGNATIKITSNSDSNIYKEANIKISSLTEPQYDNLSYIVRKSIGHFGAFLFTGIFAYLVIDIFLIFNNKFKYLYKSLIGIGYGIVLALISELFQKIPSGRTSSFTDVFIDLSGFLIGLLLTLLITSIYNKNKETKLLKKD